MKFLATTFLCCSILNLWYQIFSEIHSAQSPTSLFSKKRKMLSASSSGSLKPPPSISIVEGDFCLPGKCFAIQRVLFCTVTNEKKTKNILNCEIYCDCDCIYDTSLYWWWTGEKPPPSEGYATQAAWEASDCSSSESFDSESSLKKLPLSASKTANQSSIQRDRSPTPSLKKSCMYFLIIFFEYLFHLTP